MLAKVILTLSIACCLTPGRSVAQSAPAAPPDVILIGGKIFTSDSTRPWAEALAIRNGLVVAVGTTTEVAALAGPQTHAIELGGRTVIPGINDAHDHAVHPASFSIAFHTSNTPIEDPPFTKVLDSLRLLVARTPVGTWLTADIGPRTLFDTSARRAALDRIAPNHPVMLTMFTGHGAILNSAALRAAGIAEDARDPVGGWYERDGSNRLNGVIQEYALWSADRRLWSAMPYNVLLAAFRDYSDATVRYGITSVQNMANDLDPETMISVLRRAQLPFRLRIIKFSMTSPMGRLVSEWDSVDRLPAPLTRVDGRKWILEGTGVEGNALQRRPYSFPGRPGWYGRIDFPLDTVRAMLAEALRTREQLMLHIGGDSIIKLVLGMMKQMAPDSVWRPLRVRFEHGDGMAADLVPAARSLGVIVVQNPTHFGFQPLRSLLTSGMHIAIGSDNARNPYLNIMLAVNRPSVPTEALTREEAVTAYTRGSAYAEFKENEKGTLAPGMLADLAVLSQDIFTVPANALPATVSVLTMVGGKAVYDAGVLRQPR